MDTLDTSCDLPQLCERSGVTERTVRYYIQRGLIPGPDHPGPGARYGEGHLLRLRAIRQLQREHLPLAEIRRRLGELDDDGVAALLGVAPRRAVEAPATQAPGSGGSAVDYVRSVLGGGEPAPSPAASPTRKVSRERSTWERVVVSDDVEIHLRRPLSREENRRVERLLEQARLIFEEEP